MQPEFASREALVRGYVEGREDFVRDGILLEPIQADFGTAEWFYVRGWHQGYQDAAETTAGRKHRKLPENVIPLFPRPTYPQGDDAA